MATRYRDIYKKHYGIDFSNEYVVHHIDFDRTNNEISNLLLLPKKLHSKYHMCMNCFETAGFSGYKTVDLSLNPHTLKSYNVTILNNLIECINECKKWCDYKLYLDGLMPNVHMIDLEGE